VQPELERILARALARDPQQRYQTARHLGIELSKYLFKLGTPVSTFDIAQLVQGAMKERARSKPQAASIIDKLIEEALLEFTSLTDENKGRGAKPVSIGGSLSAVEKGSAAKVGYVDVGSWIDEIGGAKRSPDDSLRASLPPGLREGNLAMLEEEEPAPPSRAPTPALAQVAPPAAPVFAPHPVYAPAPMSAAQPIIAPLVPEPAKKGGAATVGVVVALLVVVAAGAAAWLTHLIPHN
jgi:serine/threonine-protein kinase